MSAKSKTLSAPLRVYWDLVPPAAGGLGFGSAAGVAEELAGLKVFFVTLGLSGGKRLDAGRLVTALKNGGVRVTVSVVQPDSFPGPADLAQADGIDLRVNDAGSLRELLRTTANNIPPSKTVSVSIIPSKSNLGQVIEAISLALVAGIRNFNLPNPDIVHNKETAKDYALGNSERETLKRGIEGLLKPFGQEARLSVHDLFLHQALDLAGLGQRIEYAGCQAGDAIAYIDHAGLVYPCSSWPLVLGSLAVGTFRDIWVSAERKALRESLAVPPAGCATCPEVTACKGGCRGLAWLLCGPEGKDPNCERR